MKRLTKTMYRIISLLLTVAIMLTVCPPQAFASMMRPEADGGTMIKDYVQLESLRVQNRQITGAYYNRGEIVNVSPVTLVRGAIWTSQCLLTVIYRSRFTSTAT